MSATTVVRQVLLTQITLQLSIIARRHLILRYDGDRVQLVETDIHDAITCYRTRSMHRGHMLTHIRAMIDGANLATNAPLGPSYPPMANKQ